MAERVLWLKMEQDSKLLKQGEKQGERDEASEAEDYRGDVEHVLQAGGFANYTSILSSSVLERHRQLHAPCPSALRTNKAHQAVSLLWADVLGM